METLKARDSFQEILSRAGVMADFVETDSPLPTPTLQRKSARMSAAGEGERPPAFVRQCCVRKKAGADDGSAEAKTHRRKARKKERTMDACVATSYRTLPGSERGVGDVCGTRLKHSPKRRKSGDADSPRSPRTPVPAGVQSPRKVAKYGSSRAGEGEEARPVANGRHKAKHKGLPDGGRPNGDAGRGRMRRRSEEQHSGLSGAKKIIFRSSEALDVAAAAARLDDVAEHRNLAGERYTTRSGESSEDTDSETAVLGVSYKPINVSGECWRFVGDRENGKTESAKFREERLNSKNLAKGDWGPARERRRWNSNHERGFPEEGRISTLWPSLRQEHKQRASGEIRDGLEDVGTEAVEVSPQSPKARTDSLFVQSQFPRRTSDIPVQSPIVRREWKRLSSPLAENGNATAPNALNPPGRRLPSRASRTRWSMFADMDIPKLLAQQKDTLGQMRYGEILNSIQMPRKASLGVEEGREVTEAKFSPDQTRSEKNYECRTGGILRESDEKENSPLRNAGKTNYGRRSLRDVEEVLEAARAFTSMSSALNNHMEVAHKESSTPQEIRKFALKSTLDRNDWKNKGGGFSFDKLVHVCSETVAQSIRQCIAESPDEVPANVKDIGLERGAVIIGDMIKEFVATLPSDADKSEEQPLKGEEDAEGDGAEATTLVEDMTTLHETKDDDDDGKDTPTSPPTPPPDEIREALLDDDEVETIKDSSSPRTSQDICDDNTSGKAPDGVRLSACGSAFVLPSFKKLEEPKVLSRRGSLDTQESSRIRLSKTGKIEVIDASEVGDEPDSITEEGRDHLESDDEGKFQDSVSSQQEGPDAPSSRRSSFTERFNLWRMSWKYKNDSQPPSRSESLKIRLMQRRASGSEFSVSYDSVRRSMSGNLNDLFSGGGQRRASTVETPRLARRNSEQKASYPRRGSLTNLIFRSASDTSASQRFNVDDRLRKINKMDKPSVERASDAYSYFFDYPVLHQGNWRSSGRASLALSPAW